MSRIVSSIQVNSNTIVPTPSSKNRVVYFYPLNNMSQQPIDTTILYFPFSSIRTFHLNLSIEVQTHNGDYCYYYKIKGSQVDNLWKINEQYTGDIVYINSQYLIFKFSINPNGQMMITTPNFDQWIKTICQVTSITTNSFL